MSPFVHSQMLLSMPCLKKSLWEIWSQLGEISTIVQNLLAIINRMKF